MKWYVLFVRTGKEEEVERYIENKLGNILCECHILKRIVPEKNNGQLSHIVKKVFPGYVFIKTKMDFNIYYDIKKIPYINYLLNYSNSKDLDYKQTDEDEENYFRSISNLEMEELSPFINSKDGTMGISGFWFKEKKAIIVSGPLVGMEGRIKKIDKRKRRAKLVIHFMGMEKLVDVGFELINTSAYLQECNISTIRNLSGRIEDILRDVLECPKDTKIANNLFEIGLNSVNFMKFIFKLEIELGITVSDECLSHEKWGSVKEIVNYLKKEYK